MALSILNHCLHHAFSAVKNLGLCAAVLVAFLSPLSSHAADHEDTLRFAFIGHTYPLATQDLQYFIADTISAHEPKFTVLGGDVVMGRGRPPFRQPGILWTNQASEEQWDRFELFRKRLRGDVYLSPGNHDHKYSMPEQIRRYNGGPDLYFAFKRNGLLFIVLDTAITTDRKRYRAGLDLDQLRWLTDQLATADPLLPIFLFSHHVLWNLVPVHFEDRRPNQWATDIAPLLKQFREVHWFAGDAVIQECREGSAGPECVVRPFWPPSEQRGNIFFHTVWSVLVELRYFIVEVSDNHEVNVTPHTVSVRATDYAHAASDFTPGRARSPSRLSSLGKTIRVLRTETFWAGVTFCAFALACIYGTGWLLRKRL